MNEEQEVGSTISELGKAFFKTVMAFIVLGISIVFGGYVTMYLWNGIMTTTFQLVELTWAQATGIDLFIGFLAGQRKLEQDKTLGYIFLYMVFSNLLFMLIGWFIMIFI